MACEAVAKRSKEVVRAQMKSCSPLGFSGAALRKSHWNLSSGSTSEACELCSLYLALVPLHVSLTSLRLALSFLTATIARLGRGACHDDVCDAIVWNEFGIHDGQYSLLQHALGLIDQRPA